MRQMMVKNLDISTRCKNSLIHYGRIETVNELIKKTDEELLSLRYIGKSSLDEIHRCLDELRIKNKIA